MGDGVRGERHTVYIHLFLYLGVHTYMEVRTMALRADWDGVV